LENKMPKRFLALTLVVMIAALIALVPFRESSTSYEVDEVWANAHDLIGQEITIEGKVFLATIQTVVLCCPAHCDCNRTSAEVYLVSESSGGGYPFDGIRIPIYCHGNECSLSCSPFDPSHAERMRITGTLAPEWRNGKIVSLAMADIDYAASRKLVGRHWEKIPTGTFERPLTLSTPVPGACENRFP
jgi:hypothetical protein